MFLSSSNMAFYSEWSRIKFNKTKERKSKSHFLDRDGVLNKPIIKNGKSYAPIKINDFKLYPKVVDICKKIKKNYLLIVITNQPDVGKKKIKYSDLKIMHKKLFDKILYDDIFVSTSVSNKSWYKKPNPGMLIKAVKKYNIDIKKSFLVGDRWKDIMAAEKIGCRSIFIDRKYKELKPTKQIATVGSLSGALNIINDKY